MDSFAEPSNSRSRLDLQLSLEEVNAQVDALKREYAAKGIELSGRIIHVTHYLPLTATLTPSRSGVLSPPLTPPVKPSDVDPSSPTTADSPSFNQDSQTQATTATESGIIGSESPSLVSSRWTIGPRWGHSAMFSGIHSLGATNEQVIIGWTGDLYRGSATSDESIKIPTPSVSDEDKKALEETIGRYKPEEGSAKYVPVFLDDEVAHGHYDGYCKTSAYFRYFSIKSYFSTRSHSTRFSPLLCF